MARARRACALAAVLGGLAAWFKPPLAIIFVDPEIEGGGAARTARKVRTLRSVVQFLLQHPAQEVGNSYDTNAIGESWGTSAMHHWVDRAGADSSAEVLEKELRGMKIGRKARTDPRRMAMQTKRMIRQQQLKSRPSRPDNGMLHWADRPSAIESPERLEEELSSMKIGGLDGLEGPRGVMRMRRLARMRELRGAAAMKMKRPRVGIKQAAAKEGGSQPKAPRGLALASSNFDSNAVGESFQASSAGEEVQEPAGRLEHELRSMQIGRKGGLEQERRRARMRQRRQEAA